MAMFVKKLLIFFSVYLLSGCYPVYHGYKFDNISETKELLQQMVNNSAMATDIIAQFGSPTFINSPINDMLCYAGASGKKVMFNRFYNPNYTIMCVSFKNGVAQKLEVKNLSDIKEERLPKYSIKFNKNDDVFAAKIQEENIIKEDNSDK